MNIQQDSTQVTWSQVYNDFKGAINGAADAMKTGAEHVYEVLVKQQLIYAVSYLVIDIILLILSLFTWKFVIKFITNKRSEEATLERYEKGEWGYLYIAPSAVSLITAVFMVVTLADIVMGFLNPEYGAIQELRSFIR